MKKVKKTNLRDIANEAGVSTALVSYILNDRHTNRINAQTAQKVKSIAKKLNYTPDFFAKGLKSQKTKTIGLIIPDLTHPSFIHLAKNIEHELANHGYLLLIGSSDERTEKQEFLLNSFIERKVDGLVILPLDGSKKLIEQVHNGDIPYVLTDRYFPESSFNYVTTDNHFGMMALTSHTLKKGNDNIALLTIKSPMHHFAMRKEGFLDACKAFPLKEPPKIIAFNAESSYEEFESALDHILNGSDPVKALVCATDFLAMNTVKYLLKHHKKVPDDLDLVTFDYAPYFSIFPFPILYYEQPLAKISKKMVTYLIGRIQNHTKTNIMKFIKGEIRNTSTSHPPHKMKLIN
ncbi:LacI family DNA-binding transcriptional regulator [Maribacter sp. CXY002]|uniref:LacI family DNA-binding transcriptional regulator n=1 Tax=Maribacter luteocoastalis TaxID=3407671 RepID=UPI003B677F56